MTDDILRRRAVRQDGVVAAWQLLADGMTRGAVRHQTRDLRELHDGVYVTGHGALTRRQRWWAAAMTAPGRVVSHASAGSAFGFRPWEGSFEVVTTAGSGGPRRRHGLLVCRSLTLMGSTTTLGGLPVTTAARALADLAPGLDDRELARTVREALRLNVTTCARIQVMLVRANGGNRSVRLAELAGRYACLPIARARSDAEAHGIVLFAAGGELVPRVNARIAGEEADFSWERARHIVELDGPDFHQFPDEDLRKQLTWERAGWTVARLPTDDVCYRPERLFAAAEPALAGRVVRPASP
jgi:hypothetical protein